MELENDSIQTIIQKGNSLQSIFNAKQPGISTIIQKAPQIQTIIRDNSPTIATIIEAPWVSVTSVNGRTGDVDIEAIIKGFSPTTYYVKDSVISHNGNLWQAKNNFTSSDIFSESDWNPVVSTQTSITSNDYTVTIDDTSGTVDLSIGETITELRRLRNQTTNLSYDLYDLRDEMDSLMENKVDKVDGKELSTNDFTDVLKTKLDGIQEGAEVNIQSDWNQNTTTSDDFIKNKPTLGSLASKNIIQNADIANSAVESNNIANGSITNDKIANNSLSGTKIVDNSIQMSKIDWDINPIKYTETPYTEMSTQYSNLFTNEITVDKAGDYLVFASVNQRDWKNGNATDIHIQIQKNQQEVDSSSFNTTNFHFGFMQKKMTLAVGDKIRFRTQLVSNVLISISARLSIIPVSVPG